jgi:transmembrane sensor
MIDDPNDARRRSEEAAAWFARLSTPKISNATLDGFWTWRRDPLNRAAYEQIEDFSTAARRLRDDPEMKAAIGEAMRRKPWWREMLATIRSSRSAVVIGGALCAGAVAAVVLLLIGGGDRYSTGVGQKITVSLADGSNVQLNTDTRLRVRFDGNERRLTLERGQAFFDVAHDAARPFIVDAGKARIRAIGTRFDVDRAHQDVEVTLAQGRVEVTPVGSGHGGWTLNAGQRIRIDGDAGAGVPVTADLATATAWTTGRIFFHDTPLAQAVAEVNRYSRRKIALGAGAPRDMKINGAFETGDTEGFVAAAAAGLDLTVEHRLDGTIELRRQETSGG